MKRTFTQKVKQVPPCTADASDAVLNLSVGKQPSGATIPIEVNRRARTSAAMIGLAISMGASGILLPQQGDEAKAVEPVAAEPTQSTLPAASEANNAVSSVAESESVAVEPSLVEPASAEEAQPLRSSAVNHEVQEGQTLWELAQKYNIEPEAIAASNNIKPSTILPVGQQLKIPAVNGIVHEVKAGETIKTISESYRVEPTTLQASAPVSVSEQLPTGESVTVPGNVNTLLKARQDVALNQLKEQRNRLHESLAELRSEESTHSIELAAIPSTAATPTESPTPVTLPPAVLSPQEPGIPTPKPMVTVPTSPLAIPVPTPEVAFTPTVQPTALRQSVSPVVIPVPTPQTAVSPFAQPIAPKPTVSPLAIPVPTPEMAASPLVQPIAPKPAVSPVVIPVPTPEMAASPLAQPIAPKPAVLPSVPVPTPQTAASPLAQPIAPKPAVSPLAIPVPTPEMAASPFVEPKVPTQAVSPLVIPVPTPENATVPSVEPRTATVPHLDPITPAEPIIRPPAPRPVVIDPLVTASVPNDVYKVRPGDTLDAIARRHGISRTELIQANGLNNPNLIRVNQQLRIPQQQTAQSANQSVPLITGINASSNNVASRQQQRGVAMPALAVPAVSNSGAAVVPTETLARPQSTTSPVLAQSTVEQNENSNDTVVVDTPRNQSTNSQYNPYVERLRADINRMRLEQQRQRGGSQAETPTVVIPTVTAPAAANSSNSPASARVNPEFNPQRDNETLQAEQVRRQQRQAPQASIPIAVPPPENTATPNQNLVAAAPVPADIHNPMLRTPVGETVSPDLPPLSAPDMYLPDSPTQFTGYIWPAKGVLTSGYGRRWGRMHRGIDIAAPVGTPIVAAAPGVVVTAGWNSGGYGNLVEIEHADGSLTLYAHNNRILVRRGQEVAQGQQISEMGSTGFSTGPHLHFEVHPSGRGAVNPMAFLPRNR